MIEAEIKLPVESLHEVREKLVEAGFKPQKNLIEEDRYLDNDSDEIRLGGKALRVRKITDLQQEKSHAVVTWKGEKRDTVSMTRTEHETNVENAAVMLRIFHEMGYRTVEPIVCKHREEMVCGRMHACLDRVDHLGEFLELEIVTKEQDAAEALAQIEHMLDRLGYSMTDTVTTSYLSMLQHRTD